jgi:hypothetical protein
MKRDHAAEMVALEKQFHSGRKRAVLDALLVCVCAIPAKPVPRWVAQAFAKAVYEVTSAHVASWDDVFGEPLPKGRHLKARRRRLRLRDLVWRECMERRADGAGTSDKLFNEVAENLRITLREVRELFYEMKASRPLVKKGRRFLGVHPIITPKN